MKKDMINLELFSMDCLHVEINRIQDEPINIELNKRILLKKPIQLNGIDFNREKKYFSIAETIDGYFQIFIPGGINTIFYHPQNNRIKITESEKYFSIDII